MNRPRFSTLAGMVGAMGVVAFSYEGIRQMNEEDPSIREGYDAALDAARAMTAENVCGVMQVVPRPFSEEGFYLRPMDPRGELFSLVSYEKGVWTVETVGGSKLRTTFDGIPDDGLSSD